MSQFKQRYAAFKSSTTLFLQKNGFYVVLLLCLMVIGIAAAVTLIPSGEDDGKQVPDEPVRQSQDERLSALTTPTPTPPSPTPTVTPSPSPSPKAVSTSSKEPNRAPAPVDGPILFGYAVDQLLYSRTLEQWTTHPGIDLEAKEGTEVKAVLAGEVERVYEDDLLGTTVVIAHSQDRKTLYANLEPNPSVKEGQKVNAADVIGAVGNTAVSECGEKSHLHFGFFVKDKPVDPEKYVLIQKSNAQS